MRKIFIYTLLVTGIVFQFCTGTRKAQKAAPEKLTYEGHVKPVIAGNCSPCHIPPKGNKKAYDTYAPVKDDIDEIITRINKNPGEKGFMPFKHPKLPDSTIQVFVKWKEDGLIEK